MVAATGAATLVNALPQIRAQEAARATLLEGAETLGYWLEGHDNTSVMRFGELTRNWQLRGDQLVSGDT